MAPILTIFGPNRSRRRDLFFEKFSNERRRHRGIVVVIIVVGVVAVVAVVIVVVGRFGVACIKGTSLHSTSAKDAEHAKANAIHDQMDNASDDKLIMHAASHQHLR